MVLLVYLEVFLESQGLHKYCAWKKKKCQFILSWCSANKEDWVIKLHKYKKEVSFQRLQYVTLFYFSGATCTTPTITIPRSVNIYSGESTSVPYGEMVHIECQYGSNRINRTLYCSYAGNGMYTLQGDSAECPGQYIIMCLLYHYLGHCLKHVLSSVGWLLAFQSSLKSVGNILPNKVMKFIVISIICMLHGALISIAKVNYGKD
jgi:hypothetical protein